MYKVKEVFRMVQDYLNYAQKIKLKLEN